MSFRNLMILVLTLSALLSGCSTTFWRRQADRDAYQAVQQKLVDERWVVPRVDITPDPQSRFFDPFDPDHSPLPPDDAAANVMMQNVDGWSGYEGWYKFGNRLSVENPQWLAAYGITPDMIDPETGAYSGDLPIFEDLKLSDTLELSLIHSREYQSQLENVFLAALNVTFERFQFGVRYLGLGGEPSASLDTNVVPGGGPNNVGVGATAGIRQILPAGGQMIIQLANSTLWLFGPDATTSASTLSYSIVQPLLLGAGRKIVLEGLTQSERDLLYQIRTLARFRQQFFTDVTGGGNGYLGLLLQIQAIRNAEENIRRLQAQVDELQAVNSNPSQRYIVPVDEWPAVLEIPEDLSIQLKIDKEDSEIVWSGPLTELQENQLRSLAENNTLEQPVNELIELIRVEVAPLDVLVLQSNLTSAQNRLRDQQRSLQDSLDSFKITLGLPPDLPLSIDDELLDPFSFIDSRLGVMESEITEFVQVSGQIDDEDPPTEELFSATQAFLVMAESVQESTTKILDGDLNRLERILPRRLASLELPEQRERLLSSTSTDGRRLENAKAQMLLVIAQGRKLLEQLDRPADVETRKDQLKKLAILREDLLKIVRRMTVIQIGLRVELVEIAPYELSLEESVAYGIENRLDLMNQRAQVMDARRAVEIAANRLKTVLDGRHTWRYSDQRK